MRRTDVDSLVVDTTAWPDCQSEPPERAAFLTGSHAYGSPGPDSDIDVVIPVSTDLDNFLWSAACEAGEPTVRHGKLNLITFDTTTPDGRRKFDTWKTVNDQLVARKPVTREQAVKAFQAVGFTAKDYQMVLRDKPVG